MIALEKSTMIYFVLCCCVFSCATGREIWGLQELPPNESDGLTRTKERPELYLNEVPEMKYKDSRLEDDAVDISEYYKYNDVIKEGDILVRGGAENLNSKTGDGDDDNCVCMNWRSCKGKIIDGHACPQSYIDVCCQNESDDDEVSLVVSPYEDKHSDADVQTSYP